MNITEIEKLIQNDFNKYNIELIYRFYPIFFNAENIEFVDLILDKFALELFIKQYPIKENETKLEDALNNLNICFYLMNEFKFPKYYDQLVLTYKNLLQKQTLIQIPELIFNDDIILIPRSSNDDLTDGLLNNTEINNTTLEHMLTNIEEIYNIISNFDGNPTVKENLNKMLIKSSTYILNTSEFYSNYFNSYNILGLTIDEDLLIKSKNLVKLSTTLTKIFVSLSNTNEIQISSLKILAMWIQIQLLYKIKQNEEKFELEAHRNILLYGLIMRKLKTYINKYDDVSEIFKKYCSKFYINTGNEFYEFYNKIKNDDTIENDYKEYIKTCVLENYQRANYMIKITDQSILKKIEELNKIDRNSLNRGGIINSDPNIPGDTNNNSGSLTITPSHDMIKPSIYMMSVFPDTTINEITESKSRKTTNIDQIIQNPGNDNLIKEPTQMTINYIPIDGIEIINPNEKNITRNINNLNVYLLGWAHDIIANYISSQENKEIKNHDYEFYLGHFGLISNILKYNEKEIIEVNQNYPLSGIIHSTIDILKDMCKNINISIENLKIAIKEETIETLNNVIKNSITYIENTYEFFNNELFLENLIKQIPSEIIPIIAGGFYNSHVIKNKYESDEKILELFKKLSIKFFIGELQKKADNFNKTYSENTIIMIYIYFILLTLVLKHGPENWKELYTKIINNLYKHYLYYLNSYYNFYTTKSNDKIQKIILEIKLLNCIYYAYHYNKALNDSMEKLDEKYINLFKELNPKYTIILENDEIKYETKKTRDDNSEFGSETENDPVDIGDLISVVPDIYINKDMYSITNTNKSSDEL